MGRAAALIAAVLLLAMQQGDGPRVRASVCANKDCTKSAHSGHEPAQIRVSYYVPLHPDNRWLAFGLVCPEHESLSGWSLDGDRETAPAFLVTYQNVPAGECVARAIVSRRDGSELRGVSSRIVVLGRN